MSVSKSLCAVRADYDQWQRAEDKKERLRRENLRKDLKLEVANLRADVAIQENSMLRQVLVKNERRGRFKALPYHKQHNVRDFVCRVDELVFIYRFHYS